MQTTITDPTSGTKLPLANAYKYDQLNRIKEARSFTGLDVTNNVWTNTGTYNKSYYNFFEYDANGNILKQIRHTQDGTQIEDLTYQYHKNDLGKMIKNRLYHVNDAIGAGVNAGDIDDQGLFKAQTPTQQINGDNNFVYDEEGRLIKDKQEDIQNIVWRVDGKIKEIQRTVGGTEKKLTFDYDAMGNRIAKHVFDNSTDPAVLEKSTYYILDAQGNCMSVYEHEVNAPTATYELAERHVFGSSRLGMDIEKVDLLNPAPVSYQYTHTLGKKYYELTNHLGNVLSVVTDRITPLNTAGGTSVTGYEVAIASATDYSPFGVPLDGRTFSSSEYRYGFQGQEKDDEVKGEGNSWNYAFRMHDPRLGRFFAIDPLAAKYAYNSPYAFSENQVIAFVELEGLEKASTQEFSDAGAALDKYESDLSSGAINADSKIDGVKVMEVIKSLRAELANVATASCQNLGYYCGKNAVQNVAISYDPVGYVNYVMDLSINGTAKWNNKGRKTILDKSLADDGAIGGVSISSEVFGRSLNYSTYKKSPLRGIVSGLSDNLDQETQPGNTHPFEMERMMKRVGLKSSSQRIYRKFNEIDIVDMMSATQIGLIPIVLENHGISAGTPDSGLEGFLGYHYLAIQNISNTVGGSISVEWNEYGKNKTKKMTTDQFNVGTRAYFIPVKR